MENLFTHILNILKPTVLTILSVTLVPVIIGYILKLLENVSRRNYHRALGYFGIILTSPGVIVHELSHYLMCKLFFFRVSKVELFRPIKGKKDGCLGYVSYEQPRNKIQKIGLFFVGIAPIIGGALVISLLLRLLLPAQFKSIMFQIRGLAFLESTHFIGAMSVIKGVLSESLKFIFNTNNFTNIKFWIFVYLAVSISTHMSLSKEDMKGSLSGIISFTSVVFILNVILYHFGKDTTVILRYTEIYNLILISLLSIAICYSIINTIISIIFRYTLGLFR